MDDVLAIADALNIDSFFMVGWSCGGPHALACAARLPDRVRAVATMASIAPHQAKGLDWLAGMAPANVEEFAATEQGEAVLCSYLEPEAEKWRRATPEDVPRLFGDRVAQQPMTHKEMHMPSRRCKVP
jgi:pimeloyl-ACP methyl ester carboxylesterase